MPLIISDVDMENPLVSIIMPTYNAERFLNEAIDSIINQSFTNYEFIIIDDSSYDNSDKIIKEYDDSRIRYLKFESRRGLPQSLNYAIQNARGKYIARMDADDISCKDRLNIQFKYLEKNPQIDLCGSWTLQFGINGERILKTTSNTELIKISLLLENIIPHPSIMGKREVFLNHPYSTEYNIGEDYDLWVRISRKHIISIIPEILLKYRDNPNNISTKKRDELQGNSDKVRINQLYELGVVFSQSEKEIHLLQLCTSNYSKIEPIKLLKWIVKLIIANYNSRMFSNIYFNYYILNKYIEIIYIYTKSIFGKNLKCSRKKSIFFNRQ